MSLFKLTFEDVQNARKNKNGQNTKAHIVTGDIVEGTIEDSGTSTDEEILQGNGSRRD